MRTALNDVKLFKPGAPSREFKELLSVFPESHFAQLLEEGFHFYHTTFWYPLERAPENIFESIASSLKPLANPAANVIGVEWWFSVLLTNATPQWLLPYHFDRNDLDEKDLHKLKYPDRSSVLFLNTVPYGELVVTDQVLTERGARPRQPQEMRFIRPSRNQYAVFPGNLHHGVIGRMWRPVKTTKLRISMAVNWWTEQPKASYIHDSRESVAAFRLRT
ncbi:MAG: hypothetical protein FJ147_26170 [Deltaproteobacteria bacterium]|nr:hypothetical protein [Deltaproteobacteria bacterium]